MGLSSDLISQFVKVTNDKVDTKKNTIVYGTVVKENETVYVVLDGAEGRRTPISPTTTDVEDGDRVSVSIVNHSAVITGNLKSPAARTHTVQGIDYRVGENTKNITLFGEIVADKVSTKDLEAETARITLLEAANVTITGKLTAVEADIGKLNAGYAEIDTLKAGYADIETLKANKLDAETANITYATISELNAEKAKIGTLEAGYADIETLKTNKLDATTAAITYASIDFANIELATMKEFFAKSGIIGDATIQNGAVTGTLSGVYISGDYIKANTLKANKLLLLGEDGLYYRLNHNGTYSEADQNDMNSLDGRIITKDSITASKISVTDLVAFGATIAKFKITDNAIHTVNKASVSNINRGIYLDNDGQIAFGDSSNFLKFYKDSSGKYRLAISADELVFSDSGTDVSTAISNVQNTANTARTEAASAAKTATNYMQFDNGLVIGNLTSGTLGRNVFIDSDSVDIRNGEKVLASYSDNKIQLGMNSPLSEIDLCDGTGSITSVDLNNQDWWQLAIRSQNSIGLFSGMGEFVASNYYDPGTGVAAQTSIRATSTTPWASNPENDFYDGFINGVIRLESKSIDRTWGDNTQYIQLQTANGVTISQASTPVDGDTQSAYIRVKASSKTNTNVIPTILLNALHTDITGDVRMINNGYSIYGKTTSGTYVECFTPKDSSNITAIGRGNYNAKSGTTNLYGNDVQIGCAAAGNALYLPYYRKGYKITNVTFQGAGFVTNSGKDVYFSIPLAKPVIGSPTVSLSPLKGFRLRQNGNGTHGSDSGSVSTYSYTATLGASGNYILVKASFTNTTNAVNNDSIGIEWNGTITFS